MIYIYKISLFDKDINNKLSTYIEDIFNNNFYCTFNLEIDGEKIYNQKLYLKDISYDMFFLEKFNKINKILYLPGNEHSYLPKLFLDFKI